MLDLIERNQSDRQKIWQEKSPRLQKNSVVGGPGPSVELFEVGTEDLNHNEVMDTGDDDD